VRLVWDAEIYLDAALPLESAPAMVGATFESSHLGVASRSDART
jgi:hypothetical protein